MPAPSSLFCVLAAAELGPDGPALVAPHGDRDPEGAPLAQVLAVVLPDAEVRWGGGWGGVGGARGWKCGWVGGRVSGAWGCVAAAWCLGDGGAWVMEGRGVWEWPTRRPFLLAAAASRHAVAVAQQQQRRQMAGSTVPSPGWLRPSSTHAGTPSRWCPTGTSGSRSPGTAAAAGTRCSNGAARSRAAAWGWWAACSSRACQCQKPVAVRKLKWHLTPGSV